MNHNAANHVTDYHRRNVEKMLMHLQRRAAEGADPPVITALAADIKKAVNDMAAAARQQTRIVRRNR